MRKHLGDARSADPRSLFNLEGTVPQEQKNEIAWGYSSAGRAPALQAGGRRFDPDYLHQIENGLKYSRN